MSNKQVKPVTRTGCGNFIILTGDDLAKKLNDLGLTAEQAVMPTSLELKIEYEMGRMSREEYLELFIACGYAAKGYAVAPKRMSGL